MFRKLIYTLPFLSSLVVADHIRYSSNIVDRVVFGNWVAYKTSDQNDCRIAQELIIDEALASLFLLQSYGPSDHHAWLHIYGEYLKPNIVKIDGVEQAEGEATKKLVINLYKAQKIEVIFGDDRKVSTTLSVVGIKEAMKFCGYESIYKKQLSELREANRDS